MRTSATVLGLIIFFASATISGRATLTVTYHSDPQGATLYEYEPLQPLPIVDANAERRALDLTEILLGDLPAARQALEHEKPFGYTPMVLQYEQSEAFNKKRGCMPLRPVKVRWASGAEASIASLQVCPQQGNKQQFTFSRPTGVPGREIDIQIAIELQRNAILAQQADQSARLAMWQQYAERMRATIPVIPRPVRCMSTLILNTIYTTCQ